MTASQSAVETGGNSSRRFRAAVPGAVSGMAALLHDFEQVAESGCLRRLGVDEENRRAARAFPRGGVDQLEAFLLHVVVSAGDVGNTEGDMSEAAAAAV